MAVAGAAILAGGSLLGGVMANKQANKAMNQEMAMRQAALQQLQNIGIPTIEAQELILSNPEMIYNFVPKELQAEILADSEMTNIDLDPRLQQTQMSALDELNRISETGMTPEMQAEINKAKRELMGQSQAQQSSIIQNMEQRGVGGSGVELAARLGALQRQADIGASESDRIAAMMASEKRSALGQAADLAGKIGYQDFGQQSQVAQAQDAISRFNLTNRMDTQRYNVDASNQARQQQEMMRQKYADMAVQNKNAMEEHNKGLLQNQFDNQFRLAAARSNALTGMGSAIGGYGMQKAQNTKDMWTGAGKAIGEGYTQWATPAKT